MHTTYDWRVRGRTLRQTDIPNPLIRSDITLVDGHNVMVPQDNEDHVAGCVNNDPTSDRKIQHGLIKKHFEKIDASDAILVLNFTKNGTEYYIGANTFLEMGVAFRRGIKIFLLNPIPDNPYIWDEAVAMQPIVLFGDFSRIA